MTHKARKRFGQNYLHDPIVIRLVVRSINVGVGQRLVEIGPHLGAITTRRFVGSPDVRKRTELASSMATRTEQTERANDTRTITVCTGLSKGWIVWEIATATTKLTNETRPICFSTTIAGRAFHRRSSAFMREIPTCHQRLLRASLEQR